MRKKLAFVTLNCTIILLAGTFCVFGQEKVSELKDKKITIKMEKQPLGKIFRELIEKYDVAIGFEESTFDREHDDYDFTTNLPPVREQRTVKTNVGTNKEIQVSITVDRIWNIKQHWFTVNAENEKLEDVLNTVVGQMKNYKWEINDDVVNIFPAQGRDERYKKLLELNVQNFTLKKDWQIFFIRTKLFKLPEFQKFLDENKLFTYDYRSVFLGDIYRKLDVDLNFSNLTFKELLNKITKIKRGGWILKQNNNTDAKEKEYIEIEI